MKRTRWRDDMATTSLRVRIVRLCAIAFYESGEPATFVLVRFYGSGEPVAPRRQSLLASSHSLPRRPRA